MNQTLESIRCTAFEGQSLIATGEVREVAKRAKQVLDDSPTSQILIFNDDTSQIVEIDFRGSVDDVLARLNEEPAPTIEAVQERAPGRPKLGVVPREVTLLPRHWDWLNSQPGGASVALRKLVEEARKTNEGKDRVRHSQERTYRFMSAMAGNLPNFEEASRALFAGKGPQFEQMIEAWPSGIRDHLKKLSQAALE